MMLLESDFLGLVFLRFDLLIWLSRRARQRFYGVVPFVLLLGNYRKAKSLELELVLDCIQVFFEGVWQKLRLGWL